MAHCVSVDGCPGTAARAGANIRVGGNRLSPPYTPILARAPDQFAHQLHGRLIPSHGATIARLLEDLEPSPGAGRRRRGLPLTIRASSNQSPDREPDR